MALALLVFAGAGFKTAAAQEVAAPGATFEETYLPQFAALEKAGDWRGLEAVARQALAQAESTSGPDSPEAATACSWLGTALRRQGRLADVEPLYRRVLAVSERLSGEAPDTDYALQNLGGVLDDLHRPAEAAPLFERAAAIAEAAFGPADPRTGSMNTSLAQALTHQGRTVEAEAVSRRALQIDEAAFGPDDRRIEPNLANLGLVLERLGRYPEAESLDRRALAIDERVLTADDPQIALILNNLAYVVGDQGRYTEAEPLLRRALAIDEQRLGPDSEMAAENLDNLASALLAQQRAQEAEPLSRRALAIYEKTRGPQAADTAINLNNLAAILEAEGRPAEAEPLLKRAIAIRSGVMGERDGNSSLMLTRLAMVLADQGKFAEVEGLLGRALDAQSLTYGPDHPITAMSRMLLATVREAGGDFPTAINFYRSACPDLAGDRVAAISSKATKALADSGANVCFDQYARALWAWSAAGGGADREQRPDALRAAAFFEGQRGSISSADEALTQASALSLAGKLGAGEEARAYEATLVDIDRINSDFAAAAGGPAGVERQQRLASERQAAEARLKDLEAVLKAKAPLYWAYRSPQPLQVSALQAVKGGDAALLQPNEAVVYWMVSPGARRGLVFAVSKAGFATAEIGLSGDALRDEVDTLRWEIDPAAMNTRSAGRIEREKIEMFDRAIAHELYTALLGDPRIQGVINGPGIDTLIVVPTGPLTSLPPSLLVVDPPAGSDDDPAAVASTHWLIRDKALAVLPAISSLRVLRQLLPASRTAPDLNLLALADPDFKGVGEIPERPPGQPATASAVAPARGLEQNGRATDALANLDPLYGTLAEGRALAALLAPDDSSALLLGPAASKTNLMQRQADGTLARTRVLAFSTHGLLTGDFVGLDEPALALAHPPATGADPGDDGLLKASQAAALTLNADWVVLSACDTAAGDGRGAQGLSGLARAFFHAGARSLLVSHWRVDDDATPQLIVETFREYGQGQAGVSKAQALRGAMLKMLDSPDHKTADPRLWAPFVLVGETR